jgi:LPPG:FO 2-phospho-L-lactate transferase
MARALSEAVAPDRLTVVVNVGDDDYMYGAYVAADLDTVTYTLAGIEGPHGWGLADDTFHVMDELAARGIDTSFRLGDRDIATCLHRTESLRNGMPLSEITAAVGTSLGVALHLLPATDDRLRTVVRIADGTWLPFQDYFVKRRHADEVIGLRYEGAEEASPAPGVIAAIAAADVVVIAPSNPPLSIWPILEVPGIKAAVTAANRVVAISPLFGGKALKGPADKVLASLGFKHGTAGILEAYSGLLDTLVVDIADAGDESLSTEATRVVATDTRMATVEDGRRFATWLMDTMSP